MPIPTPTVAGFYWARIRPEIVRDAVPEVVKVDYYWSDTILEVGLAGEEDTQNLRDYIFLAGPLEPPKE